MTSDTFPQLPLSYWIESTQFPTFPRLSENIKAKVAIIGAGITGITTAYLLAKEGIDVVLIDSGRILNGTTGHTTAKVTAQHDLIYDELINHFGVEKAGLYYESNNQALQFINETVQTYKIDCNFSNEDSYLYTTTDNGLRNLSKEYEAYQKLNIPCDYVQSLSIPIPVQSALVMKNQAQFHPLLYLKTLLEKFVEMGGKVYEQTTAMDVEKGDYPQIITKEGHHITCEYVVSCSHFPFMMRIAFLYANVRRTLLRSCNKSQNRLSRWHVFKY